MLQELSERLRRHVEVLAEDIGPRYLERPEAWNATIAYIERELSAIGDPVERQEYHVDEETMATNLIVERRGTKQPESIVVLGAHYDTIPSTPGADDNASAVAVLIEVARLLQGRPAKRTIRFVSFACEEPPHFYSQTMGSQMYARYCRGRSEKIIGMLCLEMVGYYTDEEKSQSVPAGIPWWLKTIFPKRGNFLVSVGNLRSIPLVWNFHRGFRRATKLPLFSISLPEVISEIRLSDNSSFWDQGYRAAMLTDTSFLRNPHYHQRSDRADTLDYRRMAQAAVGTAGGLARIAGMSRPFRKADVIE